MDWKRLETFYYVAKCGSFSAAAHQLSLNQSSLSRSIQNLEKELQFPIFHRFPRGLELTQKGQTLYQTAQRMFMEVQQAKAKLYEQPGVQGTIRISTTYALATNFLAERLIAFNKDYPDIRFELICSNDKVDLIAQEVDVAIRDYDNFTPNLNQDYIFTLQAGLYASDSYLNQFGVPRVPQDLNYHRILSFGRPEQNPYADVQWALKVGLPRDKKRIPFMMVNSVEFLFDAAQAGLGIITSYAGMKGLEDANLTRVLTDITAPKYHFYFVCSKHLSHLKRIDVLKTYLSESFRDFYNPIT